MKRTAKNSNLIVHKLYFMKKHTLRVLEELKPSSGSDDKETNERRELIDRIYELRRLQEAREETSDDEMVITEDTKKKVVIEELE
ncbi:hypothetical protein TWF225_003378 [Orbilia oligospora]|nr:hypothetical protein TWF225_003378 [Orbilia oligospora]